VTKTATPCRVPVLLYHSVSDAEAARNDPWSIRVADFRADMEAVVASGRTPLTCTRLGQALKGEAEIPPRSVLVTFDDGFADFADVALPILTSMGIAATLFVTTAWVGESGMLSPAALRDVRAAGDVEVGAHSETHPHLDIVGRPRARQEIEGSKRFLEDRLQTRIQSFAYPHGSHNRTTRAITVEAGYTSAMAVKNAISHAEDDPYAMARFTVHGGSTRERVAAVIDGGGVPLVAEGEKLRTSVYRAVRYVRHRAGAR
jgi:peptidoglycan/xylan/chitin deacetylase (PgdA/CDA1 family)